MGIAHLESLSSVRQAIGIRRGSSPAYACFYRRNNLRAVVEVVPVGAGTDPVVVRGSVVGLVVGVGRPEVEGTGLGVKLGGLVVETSSGGAVKNLEHDDCLESH